MSALFFMTHWTFKLLSWDGCDISCSVVSVCIVCFASGKLFQFKFVRARKLNSYYLPPVSVLAIRLP